MLLLKSDCETSLLVMGNLPAVEFQTGSEWGQELPAGRVLAVERDSVSSVVSFLNVHIPIVIDM